MLEYGRTECRTIKLKTMIQFLQVLAVVAVGIVLRKLSRLFPDGKTKFTLFGMSGAGKTQFIKTLQKEKYSPNSDRQTSEVDYEEFKIELSETKTLIVKSGKDRGGTDFYFEKFKEVNTENTDYLFFLFNLQTFQEDEKYRENVRCRLYALASQIEFPTRKQIVIGSHADMYKSRIESNNARDFAYSELKNQHPLEHFYIGDMKDIKSICKILQKAIKK